MECKAKQTTKAIVIIPLTPAPHHSVPIPHLLGSGSLIVRHHKTRPTVHYHHSQMPPKHNLVNGKAMRSSGSPIK